MDGLLKKKLHLNSINSIFFCLSAKLLSEGRGVASSEIQFSVWEQEKSERQIVRSFKETSVWPRQVKPRSTDLSFHDYFKRAELCSLNAPSRLRWPQIGFSLSFGYGWYLPRLYSFCLLHSAIVNDAEEEAVFKPHWLQTSAPPVKDTVSRMCWRRADGGLRAPNTTQSLVHVWLDVCCMFFSSSSFKMESEKCSLWR